MPDYRLGSTWNYFRTEAEADQWLSFYATTLEWVLAHDQDPERGAEWRRWRDHCIAAQESRRSGTRKISQVEHM